MRDVIAWVVSRCRASDLNTQRVIFGHICVRFEELPFNCISHAQLQGGPLSRYKHPFECIIIQRFSREFDKWSAVCIILVHI
jgi:hypothetical protein